MWADLLTRLEHPPSRRFHREQNGYRIRSPPPPCMEVSNLAFTFRADMVSLLSDSTVPLVESERILVETWLEMWVPEFTGQNPELTIPLPMTWNPGEFLVVAISDQATRSLQFHGSNFGSRLQCHVHPKRSAARRNSAGTGRPAPSEPRRSRTSAFFRGAHLTWMRKAPTRLSRARRSSQARCKAACLRVLTMACLRDDPPDLRRRSPSALECSIWVARLRVPNRSCWRSP